MEVLARMFTAQPISMDVEGQRIGYCEVVTFLGGRLGKGLNITSHMDYFTT